VNTGVHGAGREVEVLAGWGLGGVSIIYKPWAYIPLDSTLYNYHMGHYSKWAYHPWWAYIPINAVVKL
jgi:hypothetical protein